MSDDEAPESASRIRNGSEEDEDQDDDEEAFFYTGADSHLAGTYREQLRDVLGPDHTDDELDEQEAGTTLMHAVQEKERLETAMDDEARVRVYHARPRAISLMMPRYYSLWTQMCNLWDIPLLHCLPQHRKLWSPMRQVHWSRDRPRDRSSIPQSLVCALSHLKRPPGHHPQVALSHLTHIWGSPRPLRTSLPSRRHLLSRICLKRHPSRRRRRTAQMKNVKCFVGLSCATLARWFMASTLRKRLLPSWARPPWGLLP